MSQAQTLFGQDAIKALLKELNGRATQKQLVELAKARYPDTSLPKRVSEYCNRLHKAKEVDKEKDGTWFITDYGKAQEQKKETTPADLIESQVYDRKLRKYVVTLKA
jgi:hypothetical protein